MKEHRNRSRLENLEGKFKFSVKIYSYLNDQSCRPIVVIESALNERLSVQSDAKYYSWSPCNAVKRRFKSLRIRVTTLKVMLYHASLFIKYINFIHYHYPILNLLQD